MAASQKYQEFLPYCDALSDADNADTVKLLAQIERNQRASRWDIRSTRLTC